MRFRKRAVVFGVISGGLLKGCAERTCAGPVEQRGRPAASLAPCDGAPQRRRRGRFSGTSWPTSGVSVVVPCRGRALRFWG
jgi:hypothetical protein